MNQLILGDSLQVLQNIPDESVDLCYIDPPFFSNRNYEVIWGDKGEVRSFEDRWSGGIDHYIAWLKERVEEIYRVLKPTGSFYLHCDWHADAYIRVYILDKIFGEENLRGDIVWQRNLGHALARGLDNVTDTIYLYSKTKNYTWNQQFTKLSKKEIKEKFPYFEKETGRFFNHEKLEQASNAYSKDEVRIINGVSYTTNIGWRWTQRKIDEVLAKNPNAFFITSTGKPRYKRYAEDYEGRKITNIWNDVLPIGSGANERIGYPTQKPEALLERIIKASSNEGDVVLDAFVGGGTTVAVADRLNRQWLGIDQSVQAIKVSEMRLNHQQDLFRYPFEVKLHKYDYDTLRHQDAFEFESWIIDKFGGRANTRQRGDLGLDGKDLNGKPIQVKRSDNIGRNVIDNFVSACRRYDKKVFDKAKQNNQPIGTIIAFSFGKGAVQEVARLRNEDGILVNLQEVEDIIPVAKRPSVKLTVKLLEQKTNSEKYRFQITAQVQEEAEVEFYTFEIHKLDKNEEWQQHFTEPINRHGLLERELKTGKYKITARAVDTNGLEGEDTSEVVVK